VRAPDIAEDEESFVLAAPGVSIEAFLRDAELREPITDPERYDLQICSRCRSRRMAFFCLEEAGGSLFLFSSCVECLWAASQDERDAVSPLRIAARAIQ